MHENSLFRSLEEFRVEADRLGQLAKQRAIVVGERIRKLLAFDELDDEFLRHNPHIRSGYRLDYTCWDALKSLFQIHNELLNVWTHLLSAAYFVYLGIDEWFSAQSMVIVVYLAGAVFMFMGSAVFHLFQAMGVQTSKSLVKLDYIGILVQIAVSFVTALHFSFFCADDVRNLYQAIIIVLCLIGLWVSLSDSFSKPDYAVARVLLFGAIIAYAVVPWIHMIAVHGISGHEIVELGIGFVYMVGAYLVGAIIYATRWPERSWPGRFDVVGGSHQLWHLCVTVAAYLHYVTLIDYRAFRDQFGCSAAATTTD